MGSFSSRFVQVERCSISRAKYARSRDTIQPRHGGLLVAAVVARISGCPRQKEQSLEDQLDHAKEVISEYYEGLVELRIISTKGKGERRGRPELKALEEVLWTQECDLLMRGVPPHIRSDNGPEFIARAIQRWTKQLAIETLYIEPGSPWENGFAESFHSRLRDEFLATEIFESLTAARKLTVTWKDDYNHYRPHSSLGYVTPTEFAARCTASAPMLASATPQPTSPLQPCSGITLTDIFIVTGTGI